MSARSVDLIVFRALEEPDYRQQLLAGGEDALAGYDLTPDEFHTLRALTPSAFYGLVGSLVAHRLLPLRLEGRVVVSSPLPDAPVSTDDLPIYLGPEWAFGSGAHPTTRLCLEALQAAVRPGDVVLDIGTGTGILALAAARLGARTVLALDTDPTAVEAARHNVRLNDLSRCVAVERGSLARARTQLDASFAGWDVVVVNIGAAVALELLGQGLARAVAPSGSLILSAIKPPAVERVGGRLQEAGLTLVERTQRGDWCALAAHRLAAHAPTSPPRA